VRVRANGDETDRGPVTGGESLATSRGTLVAGKPPVTGSVRPVVDSEDVDLRRGGCERDSSLLSANILLPFSVSSTASVNAPML
jgi:hypothetical protein